MNYTYKCRKHGYIEKVFPITDVKPTVPCPECGSECEMDYHPPYFNVKKGGYSVALGVDTSNKHMVNEMLAKYRDKTGSRLIEVGNEDLNKHIKTKKDHDYMPEYREAIREVTDKGKINDTVERWTR
jgi:predicted nucleic acid-binding Zn ribbon protein